MKERTCCFTGHRIISAEKSDRLKHLVYETAEMLIKRGYDRFICGGAIGFDLIAAMSVLALKKNYPHIRLELILPCKNQNEKWNANQKMMYQYVKDGADSIEILHEKYVTGCMQQRNRMMVDRASVCIAYLERIRGGTKTTVDYAAQKELEIIYVS